MCEVINFQTDENFGWIFLFSIDNRWIIPKEIGVNRVNESLDWKSYFLYTSMKICSCLSLWYYHSIIFSSFCPFQFTNWGYSLFVANTMGGDECILLFWWHFFANSNSTTDIYNIFTSTTSIRKRKINTSSS